MVDYKLVKIIIDVSKIANIMIAMVVKYHGLLNSIVSDYGSIFNSKFRFLLCYLLGIK